MRQILLWTMDAAFADRMGGLVAEINLQLEAPVALHQVATIDELSRLPCVGILYHQLPLDAPRLLELRAHLPQTPIITFCERGTAPDRLGDFPPKRWIDVYWHILPGDPEEIKCVSSITLSLLPGQRDPDTLRDATRVFRVTSDSPRA